MTAASPEERPDTATGTLLFVVELLPSLPEASLPQHWMPPGLVSAQVSPSEAEIAVTFTHAASQQNSPAMQSLSPTQLVAQAVAPHTYGVHGVVVPAVHAPLPLHNAADVSDPAAHDDAPHTVPAGQSSHAPALHLPSVPQVAGVAAVHSPRGSAVPSVASEQVPFVPPVRDAAQAWQAPLHAVWQQNPSTQKPLVHWSPCEHGPPFACLPTQALPEQTSPAMQSASDAQLVLHAVGPQTYGAHDVVFRLHPPAPSQAPSAVCDPPVQDDTPHAEPAAICSQLPAASQLPSLPQGGLAAHWPAGAGVPAVTFEQVPSGWPVSDITHAWHVAVHAALQQT